MTTSKIKKHILPNFPYFVMFWFFNKCGEAYRVSAEPDTLRKLMDAVANLGNIISRPLPSFNPFDLLVGLIGAAAIFGLVWYKKKNAKNWRKDIEYGSARWGNKKDIEPYVDPNPDKNLILTATESLKARYRARTRKGFGAEYSPH